MTRSSDSPIQPAAPPQRAAARGLLSARNVIAVVALLLVLVAGVAFAFQWLRPPELHGTLLADGERPAEIVLDGSDGRQHTLASFEGQWSLVYFGYTFCPDVCPTTLADLRQTRELLGSRADDVQVILVSLDPQRDTPERMAEYLNAFDPTFLGLTGPQEAIDAAATQYGVYHARRETGGASDYLVDHTSTVLVFGPDATLRFVFPYGVSGAEMASDMNYLMRRG